MKPVFSWTDTAFWISSALVAVFAIFARSREPYRSALRLLGTQRRVFVCSAVLSAFALVAALDSVHVRRTPTDPAIVSLLDVAWSELHVPPERTYSAPLATRQLSRSRLVPSAEGSSYPRLASRHLLGTDKVGHDVLFRALKGCRTGLLVGCLAVLVATPLSLLFGISAGYLGGRVDDLVQYLTATVAAIPGILLVAAVMMLLDDRGSRATMTQAADARLFWLCAVLGLTTWPGLSRLLRGEAMKIREQDHIRAARAFGLGPFAIMLRHVLPNVVHLVMIHALLRFSGLMLAEIVLSYLGLGVDPSTESWGNMVSAARAELTREPVVWWNLAAAFFFTAGLAIPANVLGDAIREALDPLVRKE